MFTMNPSRLTAIAIVAILASCSPSPPSSESLALPSESAAATPVYHADVQSFTCKPSHGGIRAAVTIQNTGGNAIPYAKAYFRIGGENVDTYFSPSTVPAGSLASADRMVKTQGACQLVAIQDGNGNSVQLSDQNNSR